MDNCITNVYSHHSISTINCIPSQLYTKSIVYHSISTINCIQSQLYTEWFIYCKYFSKISCLSGDNSNHLQKFSIYKCFHVISKDKCKINISIFKFNFVIMELIECHKYSVCRQRFSEMASVQFVAGLTPTEGVKILDNIQGALLLYLNDCVMDVVK